jgi:hypothetical protein
MKNSAVLIGIIAAVTTLLSGCATTQGQPNTPRYLPSPYVPPDTRSAMTYSSNSSDKTPEITTTT